MLNGDIIRYETCSSLFDLTSYALRNARGLWWTGGCGVWRLVNARITFRMPDSVNYGLCWDLSKKSFNQNNFDSSMSIRETETARSSASVDADSDTHTHTRRIAVSPLPLGYRDRWVRRALAVAFEVGRGGLAFVLVAVRCTLQTFAK